jgi:hypothetical protein
MKLPPYNRRAVHQRLGKFVFSEAKRLFLQHRTAQDILVSVPDTKYANAFLKNLTCALDRFF